MKVAAINPVAAYMYSRNWTRHALSALIAFPLVTFLLVLMGPPPLEIVSSNLNTDTVRPGQSVVLTDTVIKPWWSPIFCTASSGYLTSIDADRMVRQIALPSNFNGKAGTQTFTFTIMMPQNLSISGPLSLHVVMVYECFGAARTVRGPEITVDVAGR